MRIRLSDIPPEGIHRAFTLSLAAMARLGEAIGPQEGEVKLELRLKNREGNVQVDGRMQAVLSAPCQRCLEPVPLEVDEEVLVALSPEQDYDEEGEDLHLGAGDLEVSFYRGEELDLLHLVEDELLLALPDSVAPPDEEDRCTICGRRMEEIYPEERPGEEEHPFFQLKQLLRED